MQKLGKYEVIAELGRGAMGVVYKARDPFIGRLVALKTITTNLADQPELLQRFYREAQAAGGLAHPNVVTIYDLGEAEGTPYIAMEYLEGEDLEHVISEQRALPLSQKVGYIAQVCRALDYAHKRGVVHRDIKPANIVVTKEGTIKVVDFGIARLVDTSRSQTGLLIGTVNYMSPEQVRGERVDQRSDIFSVGVMFYELVSYQRPFVGNNFTAVMLNIISQDPRPLREIAPECPSDLEPLIVRTLRKDLNERFQTMEDILLELEPIWKRLQHESVSELVSQSQELIEKRDLVKARDILRQALLIDTSHAQARTLLEKVNAELKRILVLPKVEEHVARGQSMLKEGKLQEARAEGEAALKLDSVYEPAQDLLRHVQQETSRAELVREWLKSTQQRLAEGSLTEAQQSLDKVLDVAAAHPEAQALRKQIQVEKERREKRKRLLDTMQQARNLWTQQQFDECIALLTQLQKEFPGEAEVTKLLENAREEQAEQQKQQKLDEARELLATQRFDESLALLTQLQKQFPSDVEISRLLETVQEEQAEQQKQQKLAEARELLATQRFDECAALLARLQKEFPTEAEVDRLLESLREEQAEQRKLQKLAEARELLAGQRFVECINLLSQLQKEFLGEVEVSRLLETAREEQAKQQKQQKIAEARKLLAGQRFDDCVELLTQLQKQFPDDPEVINLLVTVRDEQAKRQKRQKLAEARKLLAAQRFDTCVGMLTDLLTEFPGDAEAAKLLETAREEQAKRLKQQKLAEAKRLLAGQHFDECVALLTQLQTDFPREAEITKLLETARQEQVKLEKQHKAAEARKLLAAQRFADALAILAPLLERDPSDTVLQRLHQQAQKEQEELARQARLERENVTLKKLVAEEKYTEVIAQGEKLLRDFPEDVELARLVEYARSQHTQIEQQRRLKETLQQLQQLVEKGSFDQAIGVGEKALESFPGNAEILHWLDSARSQKKEKEKREYLEKQIRGMRAAIGRGELTDAIEMGKHTLAVVKHATDVTDLLRMAEREYEFREKKREQDKQIQTIAFLVESKQFEEAERILDDGLNKTQIFDVFDPRVQTLLKAAKEKRPVTAEEVAGTVVGMPGAGPAPEYVYRAPGRPAAPPPEEVTEAKAQAASPVVEPLPSPAPLIPPPAAPPEVKQVTPAPVEPAIAPPPPPPAPKPPVEVPAPPPAKPKPPVEAPPPPKPKRPVEAPPVKPKPAVEVPPPVKPVAKPAVAPPVPVPIPPEVARPAWKSPIALGGIGLALVLAAVIGYFVVKPGGGPTAQESELQKHAQQFWEQRRLDEAVQKYRELINLGGALKGSAQDEIARIEKLQQDEKQLFGQAEAAQKQKKWGDAMARYQDVVKLDGGLKDEAMQAIETLKVFQSGKDPVSIERETFARAMDSFRRKDWERARGLFRQVVSLNLDRSTLRPQAEEHLKTIDARLQEQQLYNEAANLQRAGQRDQAKAIFQQVVNLKGDLRAQAELRIKEIEGAVSAEVTRKARIDELKGLIAQGRYGEARGRLGEIGQLGGDVSSLTAEIDSAEKNKFDQTVAQFNQAKQRNDETALRDLQGQFRGIAAGGGQQAESARNYADNLIPAALREMEGARASAAATREREAAAAKEREEDAEFAAAENRFNQAVQAKDRNVLRGRVQTDFEQIAQRGGQHAARAREYVSNRIPTALRGLTPCPPIPAATAGGITQTYKAGDTVPPGFLDAKPAWTHCPQEIAGRGTARLSVTIDDGGNVVDVKPRGPQPDQGFYNAAAEVVRGWKAAPPPRWRGLAVKTATSVDITAGS